MGAYGRVRLWRHVSDNGGTARERLSWSYLKEAVSFYTVVYIFTHACLELVREYKSIFVSLAARGTHVSDSVVATSTGGAVQP